MAESSSARPADIKIMPFYRGQCRMDEVQVVEQGRTRELNATDDVEDTSKSSHNALGR